MATKNINLDYFNSKSQSFYKLGIEKLVSKWEGVIENEGEYIDDWTYNTLLQFCVKLLIKRQQNLWNDLITIAQTYWEIIIL